MVCQLTNVSTEVGIGALRRGVAAQGAPHLYASSSNALGLYWAICVGSFRGGARSGRKAIERMSWGWWLSPTPAQGVFFRARTHAVNSGLSCT